MTSDRHSRLLDAAMASVQAGLTLAAVVGEVVGLASAEAPSPVWDAIRASDTAADVAKATPWLLRQFEERPLPEDLSWLWFGLYVVRSASPGRTDAMVALSGGPGLPEPGWRSNRTWDAAGYAPAPALRALMPLAADEEAEVRALVAGPVVFAYSLALVADILDVVGPGILGGRTQLDVVVGVPDAETVVLGVLTPAGLDRSGLRRVDPAGAESPPA